MGATALCPGFTTCGQLLLGSRHSHSNIPVPVKPLEGLLGGTAETRSQYSAPTLSHAAQAAGHSGIGTTPSPRLWELLMLQIGNRSGEPLTARGSACFPSRATSFHWHSIAHHIPSQAHSRFRPLSLGHTRLRWSSPHFPFCGIATEYKASPRLFTASLFPSTRAQIPVLPACLDARPGWSRTTRAGLQNLASPQIHPQDHTPSVAMQVTQSFLLSTGLVFQGFDHESCSTLPRKLGVSYGLSAADQEQPVSATVAILLVCCCLIC